MSNLEASSCAPLVSPASAFAITAFAISVACFLSSGDIFAKAFLTASSALSAWGLSSAYCA